MDGERRVLTEHMKLTRRRFAAALAFAPIAARAAGDGEGQAFDLRADDGDPLANFRIPAELDPAQRMTALRAAEEYLLANGPIAPLAFRGQANLIRSDIVGFRGNLLDLHPLDRLGRRR